MTKEIVLYTQALFESHTGPNIGEVLKSDISELELELNMTDNNIRGITVATDKLRNMVVVVKEAELSPHKLLHSLNLASQAGLKVNCVSHLLGGVSPQFNCHSHADPQAANVKPART